MTRAHRTPAHSLSRRALLVAAATAAGAALVGARDDASTTTTRCCASPRRRTPPAVEPWDIDLIVDLTINLFAPPGDKTADVRAGNVNTIDEVPDSNWFTNRIVAQPDHHRPRGQRRRWSNRRRRRAGGQVTAAEAGRASRPASRCATRPASLWFVSFDAKGYPEAASGALLVANKIFWTLGYWQVENHLIAVNRDQLDIAETATFTPPSGRTRPMRLSDLDDVFARAERSSDGSYRAIAARGAPRQRCSAASATTARGPTIPTTSCRTSIAASCGR